MSDERAPGNQEILKDIPGISVEHVAGREVALERKIAATVRLDRKTERLIASSRQAG